ncbi:DGQHR domain-containing protein [Vibrio sp. RW]|uniref:DGQHR domain-containing protein n=1 Tax=Vibrio sp. RW TaxID=2998833 RepID=UPI0022CD4B4B|nr:DGQHR domain-containing protein [Vibrio sp. RW]MDA0145927.1 DGQHR domain-containing protein [Vibrio sp. RW]
MSNMYTPILSPSSSVLPLVLFVGNEGICTRGVEVFETTMTGLEFASHFLPEQSSLIIDAYEKRQRDLEKGRAGGLIEYFRGRKDTVLPSVTIFVSGLTNRQAIKVGHKNMVTAELAPNEDRLVADGQNRLNLFQTLLDELPYIAEHTIGVKLIVTNTQTLEPKAETLKQLFSDYHRYLKKPSASQNLYFDNHDPLSRMLKEKFVQIELPGIGKLRNIISSNGKLKKSELMDLSALQSFICVCIGTTPKEVNAVLKKNPEYPDELFQICEPFLKQFFSMYSTDLIKKGREIHMYNRAIYWTAVAWVIRSLIEEANETGRAIDWGVLNGLTTLPLDNKTDKFWITSKVVIKEQLAGKTKFNMIKGSEKSCARALCRHLKVYPSVALDG